MVCTRDTATVVRLCQDNINNGELARKNCQLHAAFGMLVFFIRTKPMRELHQPTYRLDSRIRNILTYLAHEGEYYLDR